MRGRFFIAFALLVGCGSGTLELGSSDEDELGASLKYLRADDGRRIDGQYLVVFHEAFDPVDVGRLTGELVERHRAEVLGLYEQSVRGFAARMTEAQARALLRDGRVAFVEEDQLVSLEATQTGATWGIDRVDQRTLPLNGTYNYERTGQGVNVYVIDTGVRRDHAEFAGRALDGFSAINDGRGSIDCNGHGTHVAGTVAGRTYGLAKEATIYGVRVLGCSGSGSTSGIVAGVDWVTANHKKPAVANMSLGGGVSTAMDNAVRRSIAAGVTYVLAAGNSNANACNFSPARVPEALTVGATTRTDARASFSNYGSCVDLFAPGQDITSAWHQSATATRALSGTSMASPHVAGAAALYLHANPQATPSQVAQALLGNSTPDRVGSAGAGSPNRLLYTAFIGGGGGGTPPPPPPPPNNNAPTVSVLSPQDGTIFPAYSTITVTASATDDTGVAKVELSWSYMNMKIPCDNSNPNIRCVRSGDNYSWTLRVGTGDRTFSVTATDTNGNATTSPSRTIRFL